MANYIIQFEVIGQKPIEAGFSVLGDAIRDLTPHWERVHDKVLIPWMERTFDTEGASAAGKWTALSPKYAAWKAKHFPGKPILQRTGLMRQSLIESGHVDHVKWATRDSLTFGTTVKSERDAPYPIFHQFGTRKMPQRVVVGTTDELSKGIVDTLKRSIYEEVRKTGGAWGWDPSMKVL